MTAVLYCSEYAPDRLFSGGRMDHEYFMKKALSLAVRGKGKTSPNPMVGAVLVQNSKIVGEGYHRQHGSLHAEIEAINNAYERTPDIDLSDNVILYATLEPCCHRSSTKINPPCCERIIQEKIGTVVISSIDPNPEVSGKGILMLESEGIRILSGVLEKEEKNLNQVYHFNAENLQPFVHLKLAQSLDSFIAKEDGSSKWISNIESRKKVHKMRAEYDSVLVGLNTVVKDNPELTVRLTEGQQPLRLVLDSALKIPENCRLLNDSCSSKTHIFYSPADAPEEKVLYHSEKKYSIHPVSKNRRGKLSLSAVLKKAWDLGIRSVLAEGGSILSGELLIEEMVNRISLFISPRIFLKGIRSFSFPDNSDTDLPSYPLKLSETEIEILDDNIHITGIPVPAEVRSGRKKMK